MVASLERVPPSAGGDGRWERHAAWRLVLRAFRATAPAELQELLPDEGVVAPDDPVMQELAPLVAAVQTLPPVTRQQPAPGSRPGMRCERHDRREDAGCVNAWADTCSAPPLRSPRQHQTTMPVTV